MSQSVTATARKSNARRVLRDRVRTNRTAARINRRGHGSLATYAMAAGAAPKEARTIASSLRKAVAKLDIEGTAGRTHAGQKMRNVTRYTPEQVAAAAKAYRPRKAEYKTVAARLVLRIFGA